MAISKKQKVDLVEQYQEWLQTSKAVFLAEYIGMDMSQMDQLRSKVRDAGGEFHVIKNTLAKIAFQEQGFAIDEQVLTGTTAIGVAFQDAPSLAKAMTEFSKDVEFLKIKGGFLDSQPIASEQVTALADLPPLPVMRAQLLGTLMAPATKLARVLAEPARQLASVIKAYSEQEEAPSAG